MDKNLRDESLSERIVGWMQIIILTMVGLFGVAASVVQFVLRDSKWLAENPAVILGVLSFIALHLAIDRFLMSRQSDQLAVRLEQLEQRMEAREADYFNYLRATGHYIRVQALRRFLRDSQHSGFAKLSTELLREPFALLESLADGRLDIPEPQIPAVQALLGKL
jgi:hypothetical protein